MAGKSGGAFVDPVSHAWAFVNPHIPLPEALKVNELRARGGQRSNTRSASTTITFGKCGAESLFHAARREQGEARATP